MTVGTHERKHLTEAPTPDEMSGVLLVLGLMVLLMVLVLVAS